MGYTEQDSSDKNIMRENDLAVSRVVSESEDQKAAIIAEASEAILYAAELVRPLGVDFERVAWMLEDSLSYLRQAQEEEDASWSKCRERQSLRNIERLVDTIVSSEKC